MDSLLSSLAATAASDTNLNPVSQHEQSTSVPLRNQFKSVMNSSLSHPAGDESEDGEEDGPCGQVSE